MNFIVETIRKHETDIVDEWAREISASTRRSDLLKDSELKRESARFLSAFRTAISTNNDLNSSPWDEVRGVLGELSRSRAQAGFTPSETAMFVFSLKAPLASRMRKEFGNKPEELFKEVWNVNQLLDRLGLYTTEVYQESREQVILRQQQDMLELSTPVVKLWQGVLALPLIGTLDSARTQVVMENLLRKIVETDSQVAIIDITGVPTVDTLVAQHLIKTVTAARLMGAECIISGIRPQIAQTIVHLGVNLNEVATKANLADAFALSLARNGLTIRKIAAPAAPTSASTPSTSS